MSKPKDEITIGGIRVRIDPPPTAWSVNYDGNAQFGNVIITGVMVFGSDRADAIKLARTLIAEAKKTGKTAATHSHGYVHAKKAR